MTTSTNKKSLLDSIKAAIAPTLVAIIGTLLYNGQVEMQKDIKQLLASSNFEKAKMEQFEKQVDRLDNKVFSFDANKQVKSDKKGTEYSINYKLENLYKHEDYFDLNNA